MYAIRGVGPGVPALHTNAHTGEKEPFIPSKIFYICLSITIKGNTDTSRLLSGLVTIRSGDCGAKFKKVGNLRAILISSLFAYPEANPYQSAMHLDGFQFTIPGPIMYSVSIS